MIDDLDLRIIRVLRTDGRISHKDLGQRVGLSANATGVRVSRLVERGVIRNFRAVLDHGALGRPMEVTIDLHMTEPHDRSAFVDYVPTDDRIVEAYHLTGRVDFRVRAMVATPADLDDLLTELRKVGVAQTDSRLILHRLPVADTAV